MFGDFSGFSLFGVSCWGHFTGGVGAFDCQAQALLSFDAIFGRHGTFHA